MKFRWGWRITNVHGDSFVVFKKFNLPGKYTVERIRVGVMK